MTVVPMRTDIVLRDEFRIVIQNLLPYLMLFMYVMPMHRITSRMVNEKVSLNYL
jgi:hypothetical protein